MTLQDTTASTIYHPDGFDDSYGNLVSISGSAKDIPQHANVTHSKLVTRPRRDFLMNLYALLDNPEDEDMIRWDLQGAHIIIEKPAKLAWHVLPSVFHYSKFTTFLRQLSIYGFSRVVDLRNVNPTIVDPDASIWSHPTLKRNSSPEYLASFRRRVSMQLPKHRDYPAVTRLEVDESPSPFRFSPPGLEQDHFTEEVDPDVGGHLPPRYERSRSRPSSSSSQSSVD
ncbi:hypothetical protein GYMLUDRAFT_62193 [Collybiopsis luxurians FD-317 M1]|uniref:HSF-type DNA-binding domain-containing protein n=1 Tax=Collybiopsis luxurians FD-317 M1 TaxID=944289 RepID=A0A0D0CLU0_9AGAR|nr:hypothetical protein GYMLUDRAFT_62193 [Collybiopsis luxurians FD-317 M1]